MIFEHCARWLRPLHATQCAICRTWQAAIFCADCLALFAAPTLRCRTCAIELAPALFDAQQRQCGACLLKPPAHTHTIAALPYAFPWNGLIRQFKFYDHPGLAKPLAQCLIRAVRDTETSWPDWILPMPMPPERLRERGLHQTHALTRHIAHALQRPTTLQALSRVQPAQGASQVRSSRTQRLRNVQGTFKLDSAWASKFANTHIAVVDDVMTTGTTAAELSRTLREAGAASVRIWVLARTPQLSSSP
jgi:ComF family protein